jgi:hypothetical protein
MVPSYTMAELSFLLLRVLTRYLLSSSCFILLDSSPSKKPWYSHDESHLSPFHTLLASICPSHSPAHKSVLAAWSMCWAPPWSSSGPSSSPINQLPPAMPQHVTLVSSDMLRLFRFPSNQIISSVHTIRTVIHFVFS